MMTMKGIIEDEVALVELSKLSKSSFLQELHPSHSHLPKETTMSTIACPVMQVCSTLGYPPAQEHHSQTSLLDHLVHGVSWGIQANKEGRMKGQDSLMLRKDHTCQCEYLRGQTVLICMNPGMQVPVLYKSMKSINDDGFPSDSISKCSGLYKLDM